MTRLTRAAWITTLQNGPWVVQLVLALNALWLAAILSDPTPTFPTSRAYIWMAEHMTEPHWALVCLLVGLIGLSGTIAKGQHPRAFAALVTSLLTGVIGFGFYKSNPPGTGWGTYVLMTVLSYWLLGMRLFRNA